MLAALLAFAFLTADAQPLFELRENAIVIPADDSIRAKGLRDTLNENLNSVLMDNLMDKFHAMNDAGQGIFQHDVSPLIEAYFPPGQPFAETVRILRDQNLGTLTKFKGMQDPAGGTMYVTKFNLMNGMFSEVYVVLNFDFEGKTEAGMTVKKATAMLRGGNM